MFLKNPSVKFLGSSTLRNSTASPGRISLPRTAPTMKESKLHDEKRLQLMSILDRENTKSRMDRIGNVTVQKLAAKFGRDQTPIITFFVEDFLSTNETIEPEDLSIIEKEIRNAISAKAEAEFKSSTKLNAEVAYKSEAESFRETSSLPRMEKPPPGSEWLTIMTYNSYLAEERERLEREKVRNNKIQFKRDLDEHISKAKVAQGNSKMDDAKYAELIKKDIERYHEEERLKTIMIKKKYHDELEQQKQQIRDHQKRLDAEREVLRLEEEKNLRIAQEMLAKENETLQQLKKREAEMRVIVMRENDENNRIHELQRQRIAEEDRRLMQEYSAKLDRELADRENAFQKKMQDMAAHGSKFENEGAGKAMREERLREEKLLLREQKRKEELDAAREKQKLDERMGRTRAAMLENTRQLEQKKKIAEYERDQDLQLREKFKNDVEAYHKSVIDERNEDKKKRLQYREVLLKQADEFAKVDRNLVGISEKERELNKPILKKMTEDPLLLSRIMHRVRIGKASGADGKP
eukprot:gene25147-33667_t